MGGSVGTYSRRRPSCQYDKEFYGVFVGHALLEGEYILRKDASARKSFVEYIKSGTWIEKLTKYENVLVDTDKLEDPPTWSKFGYECPAEGPRLRSSSIASVGSTLQSGSGSSKKSDKLVPSKEGQVALVTLRECYPAIDGWTLFPDKSELRAILFASLYPMYLQSTEYRHWKNPSNRRMSLESVSSDSAESASFSSHFSSLAQSRKAKKSERLRDLMIGVAALFDSSELELFLGDGQVSWIEDYKTAISNLPLNIMVCKMNRDRNESKVVYSNIKRVGNPSIPEDEPEEGHGERTAHSGRGSQRMARRGSQRTAVIVAAAAAAVAATAAATASITGAEGSVRSSQERSVKTGAAGGSSKLLVDDVFSDKVGKNLHELQAAGHSPESAKQLEEALFKARFYKQRFVRPNGDFQLRALKPVFTSHGKYAYTLSVDAFGTADHSTVPDLRYPPETQFQQVEDVLALLPLLMKV